LKIEINGHKERIDAVVTDLNSTDMFLEYNWLVKHNPEVDWNKRTIQFIQCLKICRTSYQDISFTPRNQMTRETDNNNKGQQEIGKELDPTSLEDLLHSI